MHGQRVTGAECPDHRRLYRVPDASAGRRTQAGSSRNAMVVGPECVAMQREIGELGIGGSIWRLYEQGDGGDAERKYEAPDDR